MIEYEEWLRNIKGNSEELKKFIYEVYGETNFNCNEKDTQEYLYNCLKIQNRSKLLYI